MITLFIFLSLFITLLLGVFKYRKSSISACIITIVLFIVIGNGIFSTVMLRQLESIKSVPVLWAKKNVIVVLGNGVSRNASNAIEPTVLAYSRIQTAEKLYFSCMQSGNACSIILSGGDPRKIGQSEARVYASELVSVGVNRKDILLEENSLNTYQNAKFTNTILKTHSFDKVFLVTSAIHMKRALLYFLNFGLQPIPVTGGYIAPLITPAPIGYNFAIADLIAHEYVGMLRLYLYNFLGWNG